MIDLFAYNVGMSSRALGSLEHLLLLTVLRLDDAAYGASIRRKLLHTAKKDVALGAIFTALERLQEKGFVESWLGDPTAERGGRAKRFYRVSKSGRQAVANMNRAIQRLSVGLEMRRRENRA